MMKLQAVLSGSSRHLAQHLQDFSLYNLDVSLDVLQWSWRLVFVKVAIEVDFISHSAYFTIFMVANCRVNPGIRNMWFDFSLEERPDIFIERHVFSVT